MVIKVYISGSSGNKEVKKRQQRVLLILDSKNVKYEVIDIAEPGAEEAKDFMQTNSTGCGGTISDPKPRHPLPPQIFNEDVYCGDYDMFDMANEIDEMEKFLKLEASDLIINEKISTAEINLKNGDVLADNHEEKVEEEELKENEVPNNQIPESKIEEANAVVPNDENEEKQGENTDEQEENTDQQEESTDQQEENGAGDEQAEDVEKSEDVDEEAKEDASTDNKADE